MEKPARIVPLLLILRLKENFQTCHRIMELNRRWPTQNKRFFVAVRSKRKKKEKKQGPYAVEQPFTISIRGKNKKKKEASVSRRALRFPVASLASNNKSIKRSSSRTTPPPLFAPPGRYPSCSNVSLGPAQEAWWRVYPKTWRPQKSKLMLQTIA